MADIRSLQNIAQIEWEELDRNLVADPIEVTVAVLGDGTEGVSVIATPITVTATILGVLSLVQVASPIEVILDIYSTFTKFPSSIVPNPALDQEFDCQLDSDNPDTPEITVTLTGVWFNIGIGASPIEITVLPVGGYLAGQILISSATTAITVVTSLCGDFFTEVSRKNWVKWSDIGSLNFTIGRDNVAGERPLDWSGWVYDIRKLGNKVVAYGKNGVSILKPSDKYYGLETVSRLGLYSFGAVTGTDKVHYFIDSKGQLWEFGETLTLLDYSEFFTTMGSLVMSYDVENNVIYICDGTIGYVYAPLDKSLGSGPVNITGVGSKNGSFYITSPATITVPMFEICTDIYDLGTRKFKTIRSIEVGTDLTESMEASIDYRVSNKVVFSNIGWHPVTLEGVSTMYCYGLEFRFKLRVQTYEYFEPDYLKINGMIHNYSYTEHTLRSISEQRGI